MNKIGLTSKQTKADIKRLLPSITLHKTEKYHIVKNADGELEVVNAFGAVEMNLGKEK